MNVNLYGYTCMEKFGVPLQVANDLSWKNNKKDLKFEIQTKTLIVASTVTLWVSQLKSSFPSLITKSGVFMLFELTKPFIFCPTTVLDGGFVHVAHMCR
jgi:hypothetical protein